MRWKLPTKACRWFAWYPVITVIEKLYTSRAVTHAKRKIVWLEYVFLEEGTYTKPELESFADPPGLHYSES